MISMLSEYQWERRRRYKESSEQYIQMLKEKTENLSIKNKFIATLTHEMRNFVTK